MDEHKKVEENVNKTVTEWKDTFNTVSDFLFILDKDFRVMKVNKAFCEAMKKEPKELIGKHCYEIVHDRDEQWPSCPYEKSLKTKKRTIEDINDPNIGLPLSITISPIFNDKDEIIGCLHVAKDISERKKTEENLRESENKYRNLIEKMSDVIYSLDVKGNITSINKASEQLLGLPPNKLIGKNITEFLQKKEQPQAMSLFEQIRHGKDVVAETVIIDTDGKTHIVEANSKPIIKNGEIFGIQGIVRDITERKIIEEEKNKLIHKYGERIKELNCLYKISVLVDKADNENEILEGSINLLPSAWQYPEITCSRIIVDNQIFKTENFKETRWKQSAKIEVYRKNVGILEVYYLEERPESQEGPFLKEERDLINAIAKRMGRIIERGRMNKENKMLSNVIHQTSEAIAISDFEGKIVFINKAWAEMHGYKMKELTEVNISIFYKKPEIMKLFEDQTKTDGTIRGRIAHVTKEGMPFATLSALSLLKDEKGKPIEIVRIAKDIRKIVSDIRDVGILPKKVR